MWFYLFFLLFFSFSVFGQNKSLDFAQDHLIDQFTVANGFPVSTFTKMYQAPDGHIWLTSYEGIIRFDGFKCEVFNTENTPIFTENTFFSITGDKFGKIYFNSSKELFVFENGIFKKILEQRNKTSYPISLAIDKKQRLWVAGLEDGLIYIENGKKNVVIEYIDKLKNVPYIIGNSNGDLFFTQNGQILRYNNEKFENINHFASEIIIKNAKLDDLGKLWLNTSDGLYFLEEKKLIKDTQAPKFIWTISPLKSGLWVTIEGKIYKKIGEQYLEIKYALLESVSSEVFEDKEGNIWVLTYRKGLFRFKKNKIKYFPKKFVVNVVFADDNKIILGADLGQIEYLKDHQFEKLPLKTNIDGKRVRSLRKDKDGKLWICSYGGLLCIEDQKETLYYPNNSFRISFRDSKNRLWLADQLANLYLANLNESLPALIKNFTSSIMNIKEDKDGNLWIVTSGNGVFVFKNNKIVKHYDDKNGLNSHTILNIYIDSQNVVWLACNGGLIRIENEKITNFRTQNGLANDQVYDILEDENGFFYMSFTNGIARVSRKMLNDFANKKIDKIACRVYDRYEGILTNGFTPASYASKSADGKMWFPATDGVFMIDSKSLFVDSTLLPVHLKYFVVDNDSVNLQKELSIAAGKKNYRFQFTAIHFYAPEKVRFKYILEGFDDNWTENNYQIREAIYTNLPAGNYVFRVKACNSDGVWNDTGANLPFEIKAFWYQTWQAKISAIVLIISLTFLAYRLRIAQLSQSKLILEQNVAERTVEILQQKEEINQTLALVNEQKALIEQKNEDVIASITYALRIQNAILPENKLFEQNFGTENFFIFFQPKDIVSGDFYWLAKQRRQNHFGCRRLHRTWRAGCFYDHDRKQFAQPNSVYTWSFRTREHFASSANFVRKNTQTKTKLFCARRHGYEYFDFLGKRSKV